MRLLERGPGSDYIEPMLDRALAQTQLPTADRHLCQELVYGILRWQATLDWLIDRKTQNRQQKPLLQILLRLGLYQIFWLDRIPPHAAVHETVQLTRERGLGPQAGFVNALLRGYLRESDATRQLLAELRVSQPALGYSHPAWLADRWTQRWGPERAAQLMQWNNAPPAVFARLNTLKTDPAGLLAEWSKEGVEAEAVRRDWIDENLMFELKSHPPLAGLPSFRQGLFYLQDPGTLLAPREVGAQPGEAVLDLCAAPGGKLSCLAESMADRGQLLAHDNDPARFELVRENCTRLGITCVSAFDPASAVRFDRVLIDVPCSNTGVLRRRVDLRWRLRPEQLGPLNASQARLLAEGAALLRPGGRLVYSTCSLEPEENQDVVAQFLAAHPTFKLESQRELLPFSDAVDGAFVACLTHQ